MGIAERFVREHGCTEREWIAWLPAVAQGHRLSHGVARTAGIAIGDGTLHLEWQVLPARRVALLHLPRLQVRYTFEAVPPDVRERFMKRFDLEIQRGGG